MIVKINNYFVKFFATPKSSKKKYKVIIFNKDGYKIKTLQFGNKAYEQYRDNTPLKLFSDMNHLNLKRRENYMRRHSKILTKEGIQAFKDPLQPAFYSWNFLW